MLLLSFYKNIFDESTFLVGEKGIAEGDDRHKGYQHEIKERLQGIAFAANPFIKYRMGVNHGFGRIIIKIFSNRQNIHDNVRHRNRRCNHQHRKESRAFKSSG